MTARRAARAVARQVVRMASGEQISFGRLVLETIETRLICDGDEARLGNRHPDLRCLLTSRPDDVLQRIS